MEMSDGVAAVLAICEELERKGGKPLVRRFVRDLLRELNFQPDAATRLPDEEPEDEAEGAT